MDEDSLDAQLRRLAAIVAPLAETVNQHDARLAALAAIASRQEAINAGVQTTLARIETLLARMIQPDTNGTDA